MNWLGKIVQKEISAGETVLDLGCGKGVPTNGLKCKRIIGLDVWGSWLLEYEGEKVLGDVRFLPFRNKSVDVVLAFDVLEHLEPLQVLKLLSEIEGIAKQKMVLYTPRNWKDQDELGNPYNKHKSLIPLKVLQNHGYKTTFPKPDRNTFAVKKFLRILHVWDWAGVAAIMAKHQRTLGHKAVVVKRSGFDGLGIDSFYGIHVIPREPQSYPFKMKEHSRKLRMLPKSWRHKIKRVFWKLLNHHKNLAFYLTVRHIAKQFDIVHIHSFYKMGFFIPFQKKVFEFHGDDVRRHPTFQNAIAQLVTRLFLTIFSLREQFFVSTQDLLPEVPNSRWLPNPVDTEHFHPSNPKKPNGKALYIHNWYESSARAKWFAREHGWQLTILDRANKEHIPYNDMPAYLVQFEFFIDRHAIHSFSKTALEALAVGLKVVRWDGRIVEGLPERHRHENVARKTLAIYREM